jgi:SWI/SNF-related matrix-associated actin-dependent regulator of chromatin subfamily A3
VSGPGNLSDNDLSSTEISAKVQEELVAFYHKASRKFVGVASLAAGRAIGQLVQRYSTSLHTFLATEKKSSSKSDKARPGRQSELQITIYGFGKDTEAIGSLLSANDLYLQHPRQSDPSKTYSNPHYLARPGRLIDIPQYSSGRETTDTAGEEPMLDEADHARVLRIFDSARGPQTFFQPQLARSLRTQLKSYQKVALSMMFEKENGLIESANFPSLWYTREYFGKKRYFNIVTKAPEPEDLERCHGGLLADDMGLGKTLTTLALIASSAQASKDGTKNVKVTPNRPLMTLVVAPKSAIPVWEEQVKEHFEKDSLRLFVYYGSARQRSDLTSLDSDVVITTYDTLGMEWRKHANKPLFSCLWHRVILDEAHVIRNSASEKHQAVCDLKAHHRWCLTGTPVQNKVDDYGSILKFLQVRPFMTKHAFNHYIAGPIKAGKDEGFLALKSLVEATSLRRTKKSELMQDDLPARKIVINAVELTTSERNIYNYFKERAANIVFDLHDEAVDSKPLGSILPTLTRLRRVCNHSKELISPELLATAERKRREEALDSDLPQDRCANCQSALTDVDEVDLMGFDLSCSHQLCHKCLSMAQNDESDKGNSDGTVCPVCDRDGSRSDKGGLSGAKKSEQPIQPEFEPSTKILALLHNLRNDRAASTETPCKRYAPPNSYSNAHRFLTGGA